MEKKILIELKIINWQLDWIREMRWPGYYENTDKKRKELQKLLLEE